MLQLKLPILWLLDGTNCLTGKDPDWKDPGKDWRWKEKGTTEDEMVGWHHWLDGHEFEQTLGVGDGQGSLACCSPGGHKESDTTEWLNWCWTQWISYFYILGLCIQSAGVNSNLSHRDKATTTSKHLSGRGPLDALRGLGSACSRTRAAAVEQAWGRESLYSHEQPSPPTRSQANQQTVEPPR